MILRENLKNDMMKSSYKIEKKKLLLRYSACIYKNPTLLEKRYQERIFCYTIKQYLYQRKRRGKNEG